MTMENQIREWMKTDQLWRFYKTKQWRMLKQSILESDNYECQECKRHGIITRREPDKDGNMKLLTTVHHVQWVRKHPELALSKWYTFQGQRYRNLITVCKSCHNKLHPDKLGQKESDKFVNEERY